MAPWNLPWSTFGTFLVLIGTIVLAVGWAVWDKHLEDREGGR